MKRRLIIGNWKMNGTISESLILVTGIEHHLKTPPSLDVAVAPPFTSMYSVSIALQESMYLLAAQDCHWEDKGAFTGATSPAFLADLGCKFVILGHSERRQLCGEADEIINKKLQAAMRNDLIPVLCVGETETERDTKRTFEVIERQLKRGTAGLHLKEIENLVIAYEPVWAIGTGKNAAPEQINEMHSYIRNLLEKQFDAPSASQVRIIYGGSVKAATAEKLAKEPLVDGCLIGGASLEPEEFAVIVRAFDRPVAAK